MKIGYARVSTEDQRLTLQLDALKQPPAPYCANLFFIHVPTSSLNSSPEQMVSSDAYSIASPASASWLSARTLFAPILVRTATLASSRTLAPPKSPSAMSASPKPSSA